MTRYSDILKFVKEDGAWYVYLPNFFRQGGDKDQLRMRDGADLLLEYLSNGHGEVVVEVSDEPLAFDPDHFAILEDERDMKGGADYRVYDADGREEGRVWLSPPIQFYFGKFPDKFYLRQLTGRK